MASDESLITVSNKEYNVNSDLPSVPSTIPINNTCNNKTPSVIKQLTDTDHTNNDPNINNSDTIKTPSGTPTILPPASLRNLISCENLGSIRGENVVNNTIISMMETCSVSDSLQTVLSESCNMPDSASTNDANMSPCLPQEGKVLFFLIHH